MKKIMILGSTGMLGHIVYYYLESQNKYTLLDVSFRNKLQPDSKIIDVSNKQELEQFINEEKPDLVINCIGVLINGSQNDPSNAIFINSYLPHFISKILRSTGGKLIHVSTDCVFSGKKGQYLETDFRDADDTYGRSKALGELNNDKDLTIRTSIVGPELKDKGEGLFHWFMQQKGKIKGYTQAFWGGVTTLELAKVVDEAIDQNITGLIHITNGHPISKYDLLSKFKTIYSREDIEIDAIDGKKVDKSLKSIRNDFKYKVPSYEEMIQEQCDWMNKHKSLYSYNLNERKE